jgi:hypothetical protein
MSTFNHFAPLSWVLGGFVGLVVGAVSYAVVAWGYGRFINSRYNSQLLAKSGYVDPMSKTFENKRIFLAEFCLPSEPHIEGKAFINCDIVGPANVILRHNNQIADHKLPICDAVLVRSDKAPANGVYIDNCTFRGCSFKRLTIVVPQLAYDNFAHLDWLNWLNVEDVEPQLPGLQPEGSLGLEAPT